MPAAAARSGPSRRRDRDPEGRARNARPRDGLGRPLPYGQEGVERQPEGVVRTPDESLDEAQQLLDDGMPFHAHEVLEDAWKTAPEAEAPLWKGLAQLAVGITHLARGNTTGGARLLLRGTANIDPYRSSAPHGIDVAGLADWARTTAGEANGPAGTGSSGTGSSGTGGTGMGAADTRGAAERPPAAPRLRAGTARPR
ncbi:DUF309 domain-containing protein [Streptomyces sp. Amel2xB2]|uniref:DUF309 domain-containing protein n=1 Tax=Streptomyces sp. Amel2xB2 TaxID=1305829 RepID=UPI0021AC2A0D|nr:DUF309 domain-containing protein [Streptomyces sp. Amel2xB2]